MHIGRINIRVKTEGANPGQSSGFSFECWLYVYQFLARPVIPASLSVPESVIEGIKILKKRRSASSEVGLCKLLGKHGHSQSDVMEAIAGLISTNVISKVGL